MAAYCPYEIDRYPTDICPYNEAHRLHSLKLYENHVVSCKDKRFPGVAEYLCRYNIAHIFVDPAKKDYHEPRCEGHPLRLQWMSQFTETQFGVAARQPQYMVCPFFQYHFVLLLDDEPTNRSNMDTHTQTCPRKSKPLTKINCDPHAHDPLVPFAPSGRLSCIANPEIEASLTARLAQERLILHYREVPFCVRFSTLSRTVQPDKHIYIDVLVNSASTQFPGVLKHTEVRDHASTFVAKLAPDPIDQASITSFWGFYGGMEKNATKMAISYQSASTLDRVWLVVHPGEMSGFGGCLSKGELGLFVIAHSDLLGVQSTIETLRQRTEYLSEKLYEQQAESEKKDIKLQDISRQLNSDVSHQILRESSLKQEIDSLREQLSLANQQYNTQIQKIQSATLSDFDEQTRLHQTELVAVRREADIRVQQAEAECEARVAAGISEIATVRNQCLVLASEHEFFQRENLDLEKRLRDAERRCLAVDSEVQSLRMRSIELEKQAGDLVKENEVLRRASAKGGRQQRSKSRAALPMCLECNEHERNTIFLPCGHLCFCNLCLSSRKIPIGQSLKYMLSADNVCPICRCQFKKVSPVYFG